VNIDYIYMEWEKNSGCLCIEQGNIHNYSIFYTTIAQYRFI